MPRERLVQSGTGTTTGAPRPPLMMPFTGRPRRRPPAQPATEPHGTRPGCGTRAGRQSPERTPRPEPGRAPPAAPRPAAGHALCPGPGSGWGRRPRLDVDGVPTGERTGVVPGPRRRRPTAGPSPAGGHPRAAACCRPGSCSGSSPTSAPPPGSTASSSPPRATLPPLGGCAPASTSGCSDEAGLDTTRRYTPCPPTVSSPPPAEAGLRRLRRPTCGVVLCCSAGGPSLRLGCDVPTRPPPAPAADGRFTALWGLWRP